MLDKIISVLGLVGWIAYLVAVQYGMVVELPYCAAVLVTFVLPARLAYVFWVRPGSVSFFFFIFDVKQWRY